MNLEITFALIVWILNVKLFSDRARTLRDYLLQTKTQELTQHIQFTNCLQHYHIELKP